MKDSPSLGAIFKTVFCDT